MDVEKIKYFRQKLRVLETEIADLLKQDRPCCGITLSQCHTLIGIGRKEEISLVDLASELGLDPSTLSRTIEILVNARLVKRKQNPNDRRYVSITLTKEGKSVFDSIESYCNNYFFKLFEYIPEEKHKQVIESFILFIDAWREVKNTYK